MRAKILMLEGMCQEGREILERKFDLCYENIPDYKYAGAYVKLESHQIMNVDFVACPCTGTNHLRLGLGVKLIKLDDPAWLYRNIYATAEHTFALMLSLIRNIPSANRHTICNGDPYRDLFLGEELRGKTLGIIGHGRVGKQVARIAKAFGMKIMIYDRNVGDHRSLKDLVNLMKDSDIISIHASLNETSNNMLDENVLSYVKKGAYIINTARSAILHGGDLLDMLKSGHLGGAALDVMDEYTLAEKLLLRRYAKLNENLILTPHIGGNTKESRIKTDIYIANKVIKYWTKELKR